MSGQILKSFFASALLILPCVCHAVATNSNEHTKSERHRSATKLHETMSKLVNSKPFTHYQHHGNGSIKTETTSKFTNTHHVVTEKHYAEGTGEGTGEDTKGKFLKETETFKRYGDEHDTKQESVENHPNGSIKRVVSMRNGKKSEVEYLEGKEPGEKGNLSKSSFQDANGSNYAVQHNYRDDGTLKNIITKKNDQPKHETHFDDDGERQIKNTSYEPDGSRMEVLHGKPSESGLREYNITQIYDKDGKLTHSIDTSR